MSRTIQPLKFGDETIYIEVSEVEELGQADRKQGADGFEEVNALDKVKEAGNQVHDTIKALSKTVQSALTEAEPSEWSIEINLGFKGKAGIPFVAEGETNGTVKVIAKWKKEP